MYNLNNLRKKGFILNHNLKVQSIRERKSWEQEAQGWSHCVRSQEAASVGVGAQVFSLCHSVSAPSLWDNTTHIQSGSSNRIDLHGHSQGDVSIVILNLVKLTVKKSH